MPPLERDHTLPVDVPFAALHRHSHAAVQEHPCHEIDHMNRSHLFCRPAALILKT